MSISASFASLLCGPIQTVQQSRALTKRRLRVRCDQRVEGKTAKHRFDPLVSNSLRANGQFSVPFCDHLILEKTSFQS